jgi:hypothetical protein
MKTIARIGMLALMGGALSYGATWQRTTLLDASCSDNGKVAYLGSACAPTPSTTNFAFETMGGKIYKMDAASKR